MATSNIKGISIQIDGNTKGLQEALKDVDKQLKSTQTELNQVNKALKLDPNNVELLTQKQDLLGDAIEDTKKRLEALKQAKEEAEKDTGIDKNSSQYRDLERQIVSTTDKLKKLNEEQQNVAKSISGADWSKMGESFTDLGEKLEGLADKFKVISSLGTAIAGAISAATLSAAASADDINTLSKKYNISTKDLQELQYASELIDTDLTTITKAYTKLNGTLDSDDTVSKLNDLGVSVKDANGEFRSTNDIFWDTINALSQMDNETEQSVQAYNLFGKSSSELGSLLDGGTEQLAEFNEYLEENGLLLSQDELDGLNDTNDALDTLKSTFEATKNKIAGSFAPIIQKVLEKVNDLVLKFKEKWESLSPDLQALIPIVSAIAASIAPVLTIGAKLSEGIGGLLTKIGGAGGLVESLTSIMNPVTIVVGLLATLYATSDKFRDSINNLVLALINNFQPIIEKVIGFVQTLYDKLASFVMPILVSLGDWLATNIIPAIQELAEVVFPILSDVLDIVIDCFDILVGWLEDLWQYLEDTGVIQAFGDYFDWLGGVIKKVIDWVKSAVEWFGSLIDKVKAFLGFDEQATGKESKYSSGGYDSSMSGSRGSGGFGALASGGFSIKTTINVNNNGSSITKSDVNMWADAITDRINMNLGRLM